jgi:hypothetical protein
VQFQSRSVRVALCRPPSLETWAPCARVAPATAAAFRRHGRACARKVPCPSSPRCPARPGELVGRPPPLSTPPKLRTSSPGWSNHGARTEGKTREARLREQLVRPESSAGHAHVSAAVAVLTSRGRKVYRITSWSTASETERSGDGEGVPGNQPAASIVEGRSRFRRCSSSATFGLRISTTSSSDEEGEVSGRLTPRFGVVKIATCKC